MTYFSGNLIYEEYLGSGLMCICSETAYNYIWRQYQHLDQLQAIAFSIELSRYLDITLMNE